MTGRPARSALAAAILAVFLVTPLGAAQDPVAAWLSDLAPAARQKLDPALLEQLAQLPDAEAKIPVIVTMLEQADLERLDAEITRAGLERPERAPRVIAALKAVAARSQPALAQEIAAWRAAGLVEGENAYWLINAFSLRATPAVVSALAARGDVARVSFDGPLALDAPVEEGPAASSPGRAETGLRVVNAPALWARGYTGAGVIVMNIDTGVAGNHAALASRWLGASPQVPAAHAWFDPYRQSCSTPCDYGTHGTHTMGIMTGLDPATADTVGVAFGAHWIAAATIDVGASPSTSYSIAAFQWAVQPAGPETRPPADVISCSWRDPWVNQSGDCGPNGTYWAVLDAFEAIGGAVVWSAGNSGPSAQSITSPKNRISSPVNVWATGNIDGNQPSFPIQSSSSRGPSVCDGQTIKPEAVAPGTSVRATVPGGYGLKTGTSMASPHVGGVIALLMEAFPWATGTEIKLALLATARDLGVAGEDNTYGNGLIDAGAAYNFLLGTAALREQVYASGPAGIALSQNAPNPFNPSTTIRYELPAAATVTLRVCNARGQVVATVVEARNEPAGAHAATWDGRTASGAAAASGLYFFRLEARPAADPGAAPVVRMRQAVLIK